MVIYLDDISLITVSMLSGFFVGWKRPLTQEQHHALLEGSTYFIAAVDSETEKVVGFITALSDGVNSAFIPLLEVLPKYQHQGIGTGLLNRMLKILDRITNVDLTCDPQLQQFYERFCMMRSHGMVLRKYLNAGKELSVQRE